MATVYMSTPTSHNIDIPGFAFHPSRFTLLSHVANLFLLKGNPYNLNLLLILEHPQTELLYCLKTRQMRPIMASTHPSTNQKWTLCTMTSLYGEALPAHCIVHFVLVKSLLCRHYPMLKACVFQVSRKTWLSHKLAT